MAERPKILQICHDYKGPFATVARQYAGSFADCDVKTLFLRGPESTELAAKIHGEVEFLSLPEGSLRGLKLEATRRVRDLVDDSPPQLIIAHRYKPFFIASRLNRSMNIPAVVGVMHEYGFLNRTTRSLYSRLWKDNVHLIGVSQPVCDDVIRQHGHLADRVHYVPHAIEAPILHDSVSARHELGIPLGVFCFGVIGRLVRKKNHKLLLEAMVQRDDASVLALVGNGELEQKLKDQAKRLGIADRVIFCGHKPDARRYMKAFDAFVLPSTHEEAFGIVLLEAMAASVPVVSSDAPGPVSVLGDSGLFFRSGDAQSLAAAMNAIEKRSRDEVSDITAAALDRLGREFSMETMMRRVRETPVIAQHIPLGF